MNTEWSSYNNINGRIKGNNIDVIPISIEGDVSQEEEVNHIVEPVEINSTLEEQDEQNNDLDNNTLNNENVDNPSENEKLICPECGAELLLRTARYGEHAGENFYGCSNYPKCKYIQKK